MVPPLNPVKPLGPLNLCEEAAAILEAQAARVKGDPEASPLERLKADTIWLPFAAEIRRGLASHRKRDQAFMSGAAGC